VVVRTISREKPFSGIRPIDPLRDVRGVVHLIEGAFGGELTPMAQQTLRDLRWLSRMAWLAGPFLWMTPFAELLSGFVWVEGRRVVGNVTLTQARGGGAGCWLVSNLVVDPAYRRRGIGRALMEEALAHVRSQGGNRIILQVRADNQAAVHLYQSMGFVPVGALLEMRLPPRRNVERRAWSVERIRSGTSRSTPPTPRISLPLRPRNYGEWYGEYLLAQEAIPASAQRMHPVEPSSFRVEWDERAFRWLRNWVGSVREYRLGIEEEGALRAMLTLWAGRWRPYHRLEIMVHPDCRGRWEEGLVDHALHLLRRYPSHPVYTEAYVAHEALVRALKSRGFVADRELVQMELELINDHWPPTAGRCGRLSAVSGRSRREMEHGN